MQRKKVYKIGVLLLCWMLLLPSSLGHAAERQPTRVLLLYDSLGIGTSREGNVAVLQRLLASYRTQVSIMSADHYKKGSMQSYEKVILVINASDLEITNTGIHEDIEIFKGSYMHIGSNLLKREPDAYVPSFEKGIAQELALADALKEWLGIELPGQSYVVIKELYPFSDLQLLTEMADRLYEAGIPFIASIRPVFDNTEFPAMKRYLNVLKYVQSRNGSIFVHAPAVLDGVSRNGDMLGTKMSGFISMLAGEGVAPLGIGTELFWSYDLQYAEHGLSFFDSAVLFPDKLPLYMEKTETSMPFSSSLYSIPISDLPKLEQKSGQSEAFPMDTAVTLDFIDDKEQLAAAVQVLIDSRIHYADFKESSHEVRNTQDVISSSNGVVWINDKMLHLDPNPNPDDVGDDYKYQPEVQQSLTGLFMIQNLIYIVIIIVSLVVFGALLVVGRRLYKRKYMK